MNTIADHPQIDSARQRKVVDALAAFLPPHALLYAQEDVQPYECDGLSAYRQLPMVVALPETEAEVQR
ncbi:MAG TPA: FAD-binding oxidoreductase, partial [Burkholderiales bacterium]|nr:FAD-binding oxidoreductase [Burkholderiales bacterium]